MSSESTLENRETEVAAFASSCAKDNYPNHETFHIEASEYDKKADEWYFRIFTDDGLGMGIRCWNHKDKEIICDMQDEF